MKTIVIAWDAEQKYRDAFATRESVAPMVGAAGYRVIFSPHFESYIDKDGRRVEWVILDEPEPQSFSLTHWNPRE